MIGCGVKISGSAGPPPRSVQSGRQDNMRPPSLAARTKPKFLPHSKLQQPPNSDIHKNHDEKERNMVLQILIFSLFLAIVGHTLYRLVVRYLDYQVSWRQGTNRKILRLTKNRGIAYWDINTVVSFLLNYRKDGLWESIE